MKDATGELSMTAVAVVAIAGIAVVFTTLVWPNIKANIERNTYCSQAYHCDCDGGGKCTCSYIKDDGTDGTVTCPEQETTVGGGSTTN